MLVNTPLKIFSAFIAILLLFVWPIASAFSNQDDTSEIVVFNAVTKFVDSVRDKGYMTPNMYQEFENTLFLTGNTYDIQMEHLHKKYDPVYDDNGNFKNDFQVNDEAFYNSQINAKLFPAGNNDPTDPARIYKFAVGDFFSITVKNTNRTMATLMSDILYNTGDSPNGKIIVPYGGMILNEDY
ncbi:hypothetical protein PaeCFBP13512_22520 [Paenibacillus sp. CFBP13512]|uniref:hypothetical protein n=1 Tax=Paenibacillus sp. CFBP13512 TaxID=2184007 RepID=UPI0010C00D47|nr:hypothetical protein [Paenibacillus sp. CFBP13512]TKJ83707.1 hypothetical protein PaeCFBP13512_22520 [Paenibacillus sp. CFBP13512]